jgi:hypothetical protein
MRRAVESEIRAAFQGVTLGQGISLRQAQCADVFGQELLKGAPASSAPEEINDWSRVSMAELENDYTAHLDAGGFRCYIPALMLSVLNRYEPTSMRVIGTLSGLYPKKGNLWEYAMLRYSLLTRAQKAAIGRFLVSLPKLVALDFDDQKTLQRALRNYWSEYLQRNASE